MNISERLKIILWNNEILNIKLIMLLVHNHNLYVDYCMNSSIIANVS